MSQYPSVVAFLVAAQRLHTSLDAHLVRRLVSCCSVVVLARPGSTHARMQVYINDEDKHKERFAVRARCVLSLSVSLSVSLSRSLSRSLSLSLSLDLSSSISISPAPHARSGPGSTRSTPRTTSMWRASRTSALSRNRSAKRCLFMDSMDPPMGPYGPPMDPLWTYEPLWTHYGPPMDPYGPSVCGVSHGVSYVHDGWAHPGQTLPDSAHQQHQCGRTRVGLEWD
jgi:hypothetical protein